MQIGGGNYGTIQSAAIMPIGMGNLAIGFPMVTTRLAMAQSERLGLPKQ